MGYAFIMFGLLLVMSFVLITSLTYGVAKESQTSPLKGLSIYAERETGKAQTGLTIVDTCLSTVSSSDAPYLQIDGPAADPYTLWLTVKNNGSIVLNPYRSTIFFNLFYYNFTVNSPEVWAPLLNSSLSIPDIYITNLNYSYRLMMAANNGITTISPTTPTNFSAVSDKSGNDIYDFKWNSSADDTGIAYYNIYGFFSKPTDCPRTPDKIFRVNGNMTNYTDNCLANCGNLYFYIAAIDTEGNQGFESLTLNCNPTSGSKPCPSGEIK